MLRVCRTFRSAEASAAFVLAILSLRCSSRLLTAIRADGVKGTTRLESLERCGCVLLGMKTASESNPGAAISSVRRPKRGAWDEDDPVDSASSVVVMRRIVSGVGL